MAHITEEQIRKYYRHELEQADEIALLHHVAQCEYCAGKLAAGLPESQVLSVPRGLRAEILEQADRIPGRRQRQREYYRYCTRVALGMCMALGLMVSVNFMDNSAWQRVASWKNAVTELSTQRERTASSDEAARKQQYEKEQSKRLQEQKEKQRKYLEQRKQERTEPDSRRGAENGLINLNKEAYCNEKEKKSVFNVLFCMYPRSRTDVSGIL